MDSGQNLILHQKYNKINRIALFGLEKHVYGKYSKISNTYIGPVKQNFGVQNFDYFLIHQFKHVFWGLKRNVSARRFF